ncbi:hypothetical protein PIB30_015340 [Stylosanthes scabra]|uniref:MATH domain-containing protein n=1 Tax=Stylosanthes scabra TaxID=79078 RepID=A0ABU6Q7S8_9FABA|nr:hypothetical protein [Stylosanthes scabra]
MTSLLAETRYKYKRKKIPSICSSVFLTLDELHDPRDSYLRNDTLRVSGVVSVIHHGTYYDHIIKDMMSAATISELVDFRGLCKTENRFVQLLEEACSNHPTLIENQQKRNRTQKFIEWSFTALGRVLHFLNTKSMKDMNDDACKELQNLWEELNAFGFDDLTWLELHVQFALSMKNHMKVDLQVAKTELPMVAKGVTERVFKSLAMCFKSSAFVTKGRQDKRKVETILIDGARYIWTIKNLSKKLNCSKDMKLFSETFFVGNKPWRIILDLNSLGKIDGEKCLLIDLCSGNDIKFNYTVFILNQFDRNMKKTLGTKYQYDPELDPTFGRTSLYLKKLEEFYDPDNGFIVNDTCIIVVEAWNYNLPYLYTNSIMSSTMRSNFLVNLEGLCKIQGCFVQLLEEICLAYRTPIENHEIQSKRSQKFREWSFMALGRVLHFVKTNSVEDMNDDACKELQILWEELKIFGLDELNRFDLHL